jgi:hypothetical protein
MFKKEAIYKQNAIPIIVQSYYAHFLVRYTRVRIIKGYFSEYTNRVC